MRARVTGVPAHLVREAAALFGATHYDHYEFLWALTDQIMPDGLEHHESSDNRSPLRALIDDSIRRAEANLLPHEYVHSWNGKYRRPAGLATPEFQTPMQDELLWVYEGLTDYLGTILAAIRDQARYRGTVILLTYYALNYGDRSSVAQTQQLNAALSRAAAPYGVRIASGFDAFRIASAAQ